jgi:hypothetical protein
MAIVQSSNKSWLTIGNLYISKDLMWFRLWSSGPGVSIKRTRPLFSERSGHTPVYPLGFGWRLVFLKRIKRDK